MTAVAENLDRGLETWSQETADQVKSMVLEIIELADHEALDILPSRKVVQEVLDILDERV